MSNILEGPARWLRQTYISIALGKHEGDGRHFQRKTQEQRKTLLQQTQEKQATEYRVSLALIGTLFSCCCVTVTMAYLYLTTGISEPKPSSSPTPYPYPLGTVVTSIPPKDVFPFITATPGSPENTINPYICQTIDAQHPTVSDAYQAILARGGKSTQRYSYRSPQTDLVQEYDVENLLKLNLVYMGDEICSLP